MKTYLLLPLLALPFAPLSAGTQWEAVASGTTQTLHQISLVSPTFGIAVGDGGTVLQWNGTQWSALGDPTQAGFSSSTSFRTVSVVSSSLIMVGSWDPSAERGMAVWDGFQWMPRINAAPSADRVGAIWSDGAGLVITGRGSGRISRYSGSLTAAGVSDNTNWTRATNFGGNAFTAIDGLSASLIYAVGMERIYQSQDGGQTWTQAPGSASLSGTGWLSLGLLAEDDVWVVGDNSLVAHWDGTEWSQTQVLFNQRETTWRDVYAVSSSEVWVVGNQGAVARWDGSGWSDVIIEGMAGINFFGIDHDGESLWISGSNGTLLRAIPEPSGMAMVGITLALGVLYRRISAHSRP